MMIVGGEEERCMFCDMRDLVYCVGVCRWWRGEGVKVLYVFFFIVLQDNVDILVGGGVEKVLQYMI